MTKPNRDLILTDKIRECFDFMYIPKRVDYRDKEFKLLKNSIKGNKNILLHGGLSTGKTMIMLMLKRELSEEDEQLISEGIRQLPKHYAYINCKHLKTKGELYRAVLESFGVSISPRAYGIEGLRGRITREIVKYLNLIILLDDIDTFIGRNPNDKNLFNFFIDSEKIRVVLVTNIIDWAQLLEPKIFSRLKPNTIMFNPYKIQQIHNITKHRIEEAEAKAYISDKELELICEVSEEEQDSVRTALTLTYEIIRRKIDGELINDFDKEYIYEIIGRTTRQKMRSIIFTLHKTNQCLLFVIAKIQKSNETNYRESKKKIDLTTTNIQKYWRKLIVNNGRGKDVTQRTMSRWLAYLENSGMITIKRVSAGRVGASNYISLKYNWETIIEPLKESLDHNWDVFFEESDEELKQN